MVKAIINESRLVWVLKFTDVRSYIYAAIFVALTVTVPWLLHRIPAAGATFLPMQYFVFIGGLVFGWRAGLVVGLISPVISYCLSGMPVLPVLPQIVLEISVYGVAAGLLREKLSLGIAWSLAGAMIAGRLALFAFLVVQSSFSAVYSPIGPAAGVLSSIWTTLSQSWPGIVIQLVSIPFITAYIQKKIR